jgi:hypothetical protein
MFRYSSDQSLFAALVKAIAGIAGLPRGRCAGLANAFRQIGVVADLVTSSVNDDLFVKKDLPHGAVACEKPANMASGIG